MDPYAEEVNWCSLEKQAAARFDGRLIFGRVRHLNTTLRRCSALLVFALILITCAWADGGSEFKSRCAPCHGTRGAGETKLGQNLKVRNLASADVQKQSDTELIEIIRKGRGKMPPYESKLKREQIDELVKYIRSLKK